MRLWTSAVAVVACVGLAGCDLQQAPDLSSLRDSAPAGEGSAASVAEPARSVDRAADARQVQQDVRELLNAVYKGDVDAVIEHTHPRIIDHLGGESAARQALGQGFAELKRLDVQIDSLTFPEPPRFVESDGYQFVVVPTRLVVTARGKRNENVNYQFGAKSSYATTWKYIEGSRINGVNVRTLFPDFPTDFVFPAVTRTEL